MPSQNANIFTSISLTGRTSDKGRRVVGHYFKPSAKWKKIVARQIH